jgi:hypothetical protein
MKKGGLFIEKNQSYSRVCLFTVVTLCFYLPYFYRNFIVKLNAMSRVAFGDGAKKVTFSVTYLVMFVCVFVSPAILMVAKGSLDSPVVSTALRVPDTISNPISTTIIYGAIIFWAVACGLICFYCYNKVHTVKSRLIELAEYYRRDDVANAYNNTSGIFKTEKLNFIAFEAIRHEHNNRHLFENNK